MRDPVGIAAVGVVALITAGLFIPSCSMAPDPKASPISQKVRVENLQARIEKTYRLSETETVKTIIVPGWPLGDKCVIYSNAVSSTMQCREISAHAQ